MQYYKNTKYLQIYLESVKNQSKLPELFCINWKTDSKIDMKMQGTGGNNSNLNNKD